MSLKIEAGAGSKKTNIEIVSRQGNEFVEREILPNGLELLVCEMPSALTVTARLTVKNAGPRSEPEKDGGISHIVEALAKNGSAKYPTVKVQEATIETLGGQLTHEMTADRIYHMVRLPANYGLFPVEFLADTILIDPLLRERDLAKEKKVAIEEKLDDLDNRETHAHALLDFLLWQGHPSALKWGGIGKIERVESFTFNEVVKHRESLYVPNNLILEVVGKVNAQRVKDFVYQKYGRLPKGKEVKNLFPAPVYRPNPERVILGKKESGRAHIALAFSNQDCTLGSPKGVQIEIITEILGKLVSDDIIETQGDAHEASPGYFVYTDFGAVLIDIPVRPQKVDETLERLVDGINNLKINEANSLPARGAVKGSLTLEREATDKASELLEDLAIVGRPILFPEAMAKEVDAPTDEELEQTKNDLITNKTAALCLLIPDPDSKLDHYEQKLQFGR